MAIKYPHRLTFIGSAECDVCNKSFCDEQQRLSTNQWLGWQVCDSESCKKQVDEWKQDTTVSEKSLKETYGNTITVVRTNGNIEHDWVVRGPAYQEPSGEWWVDVRNEVSHLTKTVSLSDLKEWQELLNIE